MKKTVNAVNAPAAVGPYVHAVETQQLVFTSGQLGLDPETGVLAEGIEAQTHQALKNLGAVLAAAGRSEQRGKRSVFIQAVQKRDDDRQSATA